MFSCEFYEISQNTFFKEPFGRLLLQKYLSCFQKQPPVVFYVKGVLRNYTKFTGKLLCFYVEGIFILKWGTLAQAFPSEFREISNNTFFTKHLWTTASMFSKIMSCIFSGWVFFQLNLKTGNKSELNILNP